jgi:GNAT superfamily N-acetyltransferase
MNSQHPHTRNEATIPLTRAHKPRAVAVLVDAFENDPVYAYVFPDLDDRRRSLALLWGALLRYALIYGVNYTTPAVAGVASWLPPGSTDVTPWRNLRAGMPFPRAVAKFGAGPRRRMLELLRYTDDVRRRHIREPYWYLWLLGVAPASQGQGIGGRLLAPALEQADRAGVPCYLETETESNVAFYLKRGFEVSTRKPLADTGVTLWTMIRPPQPAREPLAPSLQKPLNEGKRYEP